MSSHITSKKGETDSMEQGALIATLRALGNRTRLAIVRALVEENWCNHELANDLGLSLSLTSHHLHVLREVDLVEVEQDPEDGRCFHYSLRTERLRDLRNMLDQLVEP
jgi:DNA-binding transcriptional ArsR family regulator